MEHIHQQGNVPGTVLARSGRSCLSVWGSWAKGFPEIYPYSSVLLLGLVSLARRFKCGNGAGIASCSVHVWDGKTEKPEVSPGGWAPHTAGTQNPA